jgi:hypothetical protein
MLAAKGEPDLKGWLSAEGDKRNARAKADSE